MTARLHVLLGAGGVGKTTLAAGYALALAGRGRRVGLLGADPSRRLQDALGLVLADRDAQVPDVTHLRAAIVHPQQAIARWVAESCTDRDDAERLMRNPFFAALGDRLATASDVLAAARIAEWAEHDPELTDLVVDTAPGLSAIELVRAPRQLEAMVKGPMVRWLRSAARDRQGRPPRFSARRLLGALGRIGGTEMLADLADFFALSRAPLERLLVRIEHAQRWLSSRDARILLVTSARDTDATGAVDLADALRAEGLAPRAVIVNRTWPSDLAGELETLDVPAGAEPLLGYVRALLGAQGRALAAAAPLAPLRIALPSHPAIDRDRRAALVDLGAALARALDPPTRSLDAVRETRSPT